MGHLLAVVDDDHEPAPLGATLTVLSFAVIEYTLGGDPPSQWYHAPQIRVAETSGALAVELDRLDLQIAGSGAPPLALSLAGVTIGPGESRELIGERYGDYEFAYYELGLRTHFCDVTAAITYHDATGRTHSVSARGPVVPGEKPATCTNARSALLPIPCW